MRPQHRPQGIRIARSAAGQNEPDITIAVRNTPVVKRIPVGRLRVRNFYIFWRAVVGAS